MAQLKSTVVQGALTVTGNVVANKIIKTGGTSDQILMADGSTASKSEIMGLINAAVVLKGTLGTGGTITSLPTATSSNLGYAYKVITGDVYAIPDSSGEKAKIGDLFVCYTPDNTNYSWMHIPSGDDIEDTWRPIKLEGTQILANGNTTNALNFIAGTNVSISNNSGSLTFSATDTTYGADKGISLSNGKFGHSNTAVTAVTTAGFYKIKYDTYGHITGTTAVTKADLTGLGVLASESDTLQTVTTRGATTDKAITTAGFAKSGSSDSYVLLGGGGHKAVSDFATSGSLGDYLPIAGGTLTGALGFKSMYLIKPVADYTCNTSNVSGAITINLPANIGNTMISLWIDVYNYVEDTSFSVHVGGYTYNNSTWEHRPSVMVYGANHKVRLGHNGTNFVIYIGELTSSWAYPQISVRNVLLGFGGTYTNWYKDWTINFTTDSFKGTKVIEKSDKVWTTKNDGASSGLDADLLDGQQGTYYLNYNNFTNKPTIPNPANYYWANIQVSASSSKTTEPIFAKVGVAEKSTIQYNTTEGCLEFVFA